MGSAPEWYYLLKAAEYYGVPPWELLDRPVAWREYAIWLLQAESHAAEMERQHPVT